MKLGLTLACCLVLLLCGTLLLAQPEGGMRTLGRASSGTTRAVIVGISKYGEGIRTLQFAHRDAEAYAGFLQSKVGGNVPEENIRILLNEQATLAAIDDALFWLRTSSQKGDKAIFYFSGHGDVETDAHWDFGYLLCSDSPPNNFRNNAVRVEDLDLLAIELSTVREAQTLFIIDACRSGTLSEGRQVPHSHLSNQRANEVRILSCKADQVSIEGTQWGGGRGVFSWHLLRGLQGLADDPDLDPDPEVVTLEELDLFLRKNIRRATQNLVPPQYQDPIVSGQERFLMANVDADILAEVRAADMIGDDHSGVIASRGGGEMVALSSSNEEEEAKLTQSGFFETLKEIQLLEEMDLRPLLAVSKSNLPSAFLELVQSQDSAFTRVDWLKSEAILSLTLADILDAADANDVQRFNLRMAVYLHDYGQELINRYLQVDKSEIGARAFHTESESKFARHPAIFTLALSLLPEDHPLVPRLKVKEQYYKGVATRVFATGLSDYKSSLQEALRIQLKALQMDDKAPYIHNELGILYRSLEQQDKAIHHFKEATSLAPSWGLPFHNLATIYFQQKNYPQSREMAEAALARSPHYFGVHIQLGQLHEEDGHLLRAEEAYYKAHKLEPNHFLPHRQLGYLYLRTAEYDEAEEQLFLYREKSKGVPRSWLKDQAFSMVLAPSFSMPLEPLPPMDLSQVFDPQVAYDYAIHQMQAEAYPEAEKGLKRVIELDPEFPRVWEQISWLFVQMERLGEAEYAIRMARERNGDNVSLLMLHADILEHWERFDGAIPLVEEVNRQEPTFIPAFTRLGRLYENAGRHQDAEALYHRLRQAEAEIGINRLLRLYIAMREKYPEDVHWSFRMANFLRPFCDDVPADNEVHYLPIPLNPMPSSSNYMPALVEEYYPEILQYSGERTDELLTTWPNVCITLDEQLDFLVNAPLNPLELVQVRDMRAGIRRKRLRWEEALTEIQPTLDVRTSRVDGQDRLLHIYTQYPYPFTEWQVMADQYEKGQLRFPDHLRLARAFSLAGSFDTCATLADSAMVLDLDKRHEEDIAWILARNAWLQNDVKEAFEKHRDLSSSSKGAQAAYTLARLEAMQKRDKKALDWVEEALKNGFAHGEVLLMDPVMAEVRGLKGWKALIRKYRVVLPE